ncbi:MAG: CdvA-like protein [Thermoproteota archaeon]
MSSDEIEIVGKSVKDMYGTSMGKVVGTITAIDGSIDTVGIDCGSDVLKQVPFEQLVVKEDVVIFIPKWRLDSHRLLRAKELALRRLKALMNLSAENEEMKEDAGLIHEKYKTQLQSLNETEAKIKNTLDKRKAELDEHLKSVKMFLFDGKVQFNSDEIAQSKFDSIKSQTAEIMERISHEKAEILNIQQRIADLSLDDLPTETPKQQIEESAQSYLESAKDEEPVVTLPEVPQNVEAPPEVPRDVETKDAVHNYACIIAQQNKKPDDTEPGDWLTRMQAQ